MTDPMPTSHPIQDERPTPEQLDVALRQFDLARSGSPSLFTKAELVAAGFRLAAEVRALRAELLRRADLCQVLGEHVEAVHAALDVAEDAEPSGAQSAAVRAIHALAARAPQPAVPDGEDVRVAVPRAQLRGWYDVLNAVSAVKELPLSAADQLGHTAGSVAYWAQQAPEPPR